MRVLITGGAGFIGSHITEELLLQNHQVAVVDNLSSGKKSQVPLEASFYQKDIRQKDLGEVFDEFRPDYVIHLAAQVSVSKSIQQPFHDCEENILATINVLESCVKHHVKKLVFASTAALYGDPQYLPIDEQHGMNPTSFYGLSKKIAESYIKMFAEYHGLTYTILRYANVYGMRQDAYGEAGVIAIFIEQLLSSQPLHIFGDGAQTRDFVFVKDVAKANVAALTRGENETINISTGQQTSLLTIINELRMITSEEVSPAFGHERRGDIRHSCLSNAKAKELLDWVPAYSLAEGLRATIHYYQQKAVV
ncbi:NAD-dependent epimerase/dehydratase family protein [Bacillus badius]|uniref:UDP-glucose 4-epimerase n=1 Tax=Bacillus badius TaxID=1455 RepID=A0ABR5ARH0_BACBA|nr:NAD-dependent epimerase/dehydratase family protein [Bacillus badius]KIL73780.1 UDP-glucose 4-epimerase [Bacillus badius]KIL77235.1 UDP-glucose 4-epimerase [Bacillus badius]KZO01080.1 UDP-glucose 4-epimerase [Bacillus badius]KZR59540.1 UDP-glucose 4-epimerase [Bacillus badius]MED0667980.1 NAD-dependent epimerase/dehydratase family protein [Bacillus badius]